MKTLTKTLLALALAFAAAQLWAAGPTGIGGLQIGMTKAQVEALDKSAEVYLSTPLTQVASQKLEPDPGTEAYETMLVAPFGAAPMKANLTFSGGRLQRIHISFDGEQQRNLIKSAITSKYGEPVVVDKTTEERCLYGNGANFTIRTGDIDHLWQQGGDTEKPVETKLWQYIIDMCPVSLRGPAIGATSIYSLTIREKTKDAAKDISEVF